MGQWLRKRARYLDLMLENEGITRPSICSTCGDAMEVKCFDCLGNNYFCTPCSITSHKRTPFHRLGRWTGAHFAPISLHSLGFLFCLGHYGKPCPYTKEVCIYELFHMVCLDIICRALMHLRYMIARSKTV